MDHLRSPSGVPPSGSMESLGMQDNGGSVQVHHRPLSTKRSSKNSNYSRGSRKRVTPAAVVDFTGHKQPGQVSTKEMKRIIAIKHA